MNKGQSEGGEDGKEGGRNREREERGKKLSEEHRIRHNLTSEELPELWHNPTVS